MGRMTLRERVQIWLGMDKLASTGLLLAHEKLEKSRHAIIVQELANIQTLMQNQHIGQPQNFVPPVLDWDTVQAMALAELERDPKREN